MNITEQDYKRRINHIFVNKTDNGSITDSVVSAIKYVQKDARKKVFVLPEFEDVAKKIGIGGLASSKRGIICGIDKKGKTDGECLDFMTYQTKFGLLVLTDENLSVSDFNVFLAETFLKKSVDVIMHKTSLMLNAIEEKMLKNAKNGLINENKMERNFVWRIYPDPSFVFSIELYKQMFDIYGHIDAVGIILTQMFVNSKKYDSFAYYNFFFRDQNEINKYDMDKEFDNICSIIKFNDTNKSLLYEKLFMKNMDFPEETKQTENTSDNMKQEQEELQNETVEPKTIPLYPEKETTEELTDEQKIDKQIGLLLQDFTDKIDSGELTPASMVTDQEKVGELMLSFYEPVADLIAPKDFFARFQNKVMTI